MNCPACGVTVVTRLFFLLPNQQVFRCVCGHLLPRPLLEQALSKELGSQLQIKRNAKWHWPDDKPVKGMCPPSKQLSICQRLRAQLRGVAAILKEVLANGRSF